MRGKHAGTQAHVVCNCVLVLLLDGQQAQDKTRLLLNLLATAGAQSVLARLRKCACRRGGLACGSISSARCWLNGDSAAAAASSTHHCGYPGSCVRAREFPPPAPVRTGRWGPPRPRRHRRSAAAPPPGWHRQRPPGPRFPLRAGGGHSAKTPAHSHQRVRVARGRLRRLCWGPSSPRTPARPGCFKHPARAANPGLRATILPAPRPGGPAARPLDSQAQPGLRRRAEPVLASSARPWAARRRTTRSTCSVPCVKPVMVSTSRFTCVTPGVSPRPRLPTPAPTPAPRRRAEPTGPMFAPVRARSPPRAGSGPPA